MRKERGTKKNDTFYSTNDCYEKVVVESGLNHYLGKGVSNHNGLGPSEYNLIKNITMQSPPRFPLLTSDRGLFS